MAKKTVDNIRAAIVRSIDHSDLTAALERAGIDTDICETRVKDDGSIYIGGGENDTAFEVEFEINITEITVGWSTWEVDRKSSVSGSDRG